MIRTMPEAQDAALFPGPGSLALRKRVAVGQAAALSGLRLLSEMSGVVAQILLAAESVQVWGDWRRLRS